MPAARARTGFAARLKSVRHQRGLSQLQLALEAGISPRHLSFLETGRAKPSREMVLLLAERLRVPLRGQNAMLQAAGFAATWPQHTLQADELAAVRSAALRVLQNHEPFPAIAINREREVVLHNQAAARVFALVAPSLRKPPINVFRAILHPRGLSQHIVDFDAYSRFLLARLHRDAATMGDGSLDALIAEIEAYPNMRAQAEATLPDHDVALVLRVRDGDGVLSFITTLATFGTPFDITVSELVIESLFPADDYTSVRLHQMAEIAQIDR